MKKFDYLLFSCIAVSTFLFSCSKDIGDNVSQEKGLDSVENYSNINSISQNLCSFISSVYKANTFDENTIFQLAQNSSKDSFSSSTMTKSGYSSIPSGNWDLNDNQSKAISDIITNIIDNDFICEKSSKECNDIILNTPESDQGLVLLFYLTTQHILEDFSILFPTTKSSYWEEFWVSLAASIPPAIWGSAIGMVIEDAAVGAAVGGAIGLIVGAAAGVAILHYANTVVVEGIIVDETGDPIPGVTISATGSSNGTTSNYNGIFSFRAPINSKIIISLVGYKTEVIDTNKPDIKRIVLKEE